jgi:putative inorganic carbon (hco3(-)) transporter
VQRARRASKGYLGHVKRWVRPATARSDEPPTSVRSEPLMSPGSYPPLANQAGGRGSDAASRLDQRLLSLDPRAAWAAVRSEPVSFWCLCLYFMVEYVRPQGIVPAIDVIPWGRTTLALTLIAFAFEGKWTRKPNLLDGFMILFTIVLFLSSLFAIYPEWSTDSWSVFINWVLIYYLVTGIVTTERRFFIFLALFLLWSFKLSQFGARSFILRGFAFTTWGIQGPRGWFQNSGELAIQMCVFFAMSVLFAVGLKGYLGRWKFWGLLALLPGTAALTVIASSSRGGQLGLAAVILLLVLQTKHRIRGLVAGAVVLAALWAVLPDEQRERFDAMGDDQTSINRTTYWEHGMEIAANYPVLGIGFRNWLPYYRTNYNPQGELPHNIFVEAGAELGYTGFIALILLMAGTFVLNHRTRRMARRLPVWGPFLRATALGLDGALVGFAVSGFFVTVLYYPYFWVNLAFTAALFGTTRRAASRARRLATPEPVMQVRPSTWQPPVPVGRPGIPQPVGRLANNPMARGPG